MRSKTFFCFRFTANQDQHELVYSPRDWKIFRKFREIEPKLIKITMRETWCPLLVSLKVKWGYISAYNLETERALLLPVSISLKIKAIIS